LVIDTCSVVEWIHLTAEWYQKRGPVILLVPEEWVGNGLEVRALSVGVRGIVPLSPCFEQEILDAVHSILNGRIWLPVDAIQHLSRSGMEVFTAYSSRFTKREQQILAPLLGGFANKRIAAAMCLSERTVKYHVSHILRKFKVVNRRELFLKRRDLGLDLLSLGADWKPESGSTESSLSRKLL
jgi:DNA-binding NarL/FixJ family response regulator